MHSVRQILKEKTSGTIWSVSPDDSVLDAIKFMAEKRIGAVLVMEGDRLEGIMSERDYARKVILKGRKSAETRVREIMTSDVKTIPPETTAQQGLALMTEGFFRHLPVVEDDQVIGVVSIGDLVAAVIEDQKSLIDQLERYVTG